MFADQVDCRSERCDDNNLNFQETQCVCVCVVLQMCHLASDERSRRILTG